MRLVFAAPLLALTLVGCGAVGAIDIPLGQPAGNATGMPTDLTAAAAPTTPVEEGAALPPPAGYDPGPVAATAGTPPADAGGTPPAGPQTAAIDPAAAGGGPTLGRTDLLGGWTVTAGSDTCQLFMTLTAWTGGYRASTRDCSSQVLAQISAWDLDGQQVTLASADGTALATLTSVGGGRFEGTLAAGGTPISFFR